MNTQFYFQKIKQLFGLLFLFCLSYTNISAQANSCQGYTLTQGGWGAPNLDNPHVSYMYNNFNGAFPTGITVGCNSGYQLKLTSAAAVTDFLPSGGTSGALTANYTNPGTSLSNTLAGQLVSVMLAVGFDKYDASFSTPTATLGDYVFTGGPFMGKTVNQFLQLANNFMGGCGTSAYSATQFNEAATAINENFDEGTTDLGYLRCCMLDINVTYDAIKCYGGTTVVHVAAINGSSATTGTGDFTRGEGTYTFTVTDGSCSKSQTITITQPTQLKIELSATPIMCKGGDATVTVAASGGTGAYTGTGTFTVKAGTYSYTVTDENGCQVTDSITINEPDQLSLRLTIAEMSCASSTDNVSVNVSGGTPEYSYLWSNGQTGPSAKLPSGAFSVTVTDANGCKATASGTVPPRDCGTFTTVTQGGWGAKASGKNWGAFRNQYFASAFPTGLTVGAGSKFLKLTSAKAVEDFLPSGSTPRALNPGTMINPGGSYSNVLAGQVVALTLNVRFDEVVASFSPSPTKLGDMVVASGTFEGWSVYQVLNEANKVLGGISSYSAAEMNAMVDAINNNYDGGKMNNGMLTCPCPDAAKTVIAPAAVVQPMTPAATATEAALYPNPSNGEFTVRFDAEANSPVSVQIYDLAGKMMGDYSSSVVRNGQKAQVNISDYKLAGGVYIVKVKTSTTQKTLKLIIKK